MKKLYRIGVTAGVLSLVLGAVPAFAQIKVGVLLPLSGGGAATGIGIQSGVKLAVQEINATGGVKGQPLEILVRDTQMKPDLASATAKELLTKNGVKLLIGPGTSGEALAVSEFAKNEKVVMISPSAKTESLTSAPNLHDYVFQLLATTDVDGLRTANLLKEIDAKNVCFAGYDYPYTTDFFKAIRAHMGAIKDAGNFLVPIGTSDYSSMITQLMASSCDTVIGTVFGGGFISLVKQAAPFGVFKTKKLVWGAIMGQYTMAEALKGEFPEGMWATALDLWYVNGNEEHQKYQSELAKFEGKKETDMWAITGYNSVRLLKAAIEKAGSAEPAAVAAALKGLTIATPLGEITIDPKTHRGSSPEFYGQVTTVKGSVVKQMTNVRLVK